MKALKIILFIAIIGAAGFAGGFFMKGGSAGGAGGDSAATHEHGEDADIQYYTCGMHPNVIQDHPGNCPICGMKLTPLKNNSGDSSDSGKGSGERKILYWVAPMDPNYIRNEPGKSPMGMDLVPVYEDEVSGGSSVTIDPTVVQNMGVRTARVEVGSMERVIRTVGHVDYDQDLHGVVNTKIGGWIEELHVKEDGVFVEKGQPLYDIYSPELVAAQEEFLLSLKSGSESIAKAARKRLRYWDISDGQINHLEKSREVEKTLTIYSPYQGIVTDRNVMEGQFYMKGTGLFHIDDLSKVWVYAHIYEYELPFVKLGQEAEMTLSYIPGKTYRGKVTYVYPFLDKKTRDVKLRLEFDNTDMALKPNMYANASIRSKVADDAILIPTEAILKAGERNTAFVVKGKGTFEPRLLNLGPDNGEGKTQVLSGLAAGEMVVVSGQFLLDSESKLKEALNKMLESEKGAPAGGAEQSAPAGPDENMAGMDMKKPEADHAGHSDWLDPAKGEYVCPMEGDDYYSDEPGNCPKCGMTLLKTDEYRKELGKESVQDESADGEGMKMDSGDMGGMDMNGKGDR